MWQNNMITIPDGWSISTHTSRVGCDQFQLIRPVHLMNFYSHIPCGMWLLFPSKPTLTAYFYSHIPCGMWPCARRSRIGCIGNFYSHIPCGMWPSKCTFICASIIISTHTSRVGCDRMATARRTKKCVISTHTSRVGCDRQSILCTSDISDFYSHIPCGMWQIRRRII